MEPNRNTYQPPVELPQPLEHGGMQPPAGQGEARAAAPERVGAVPPPQAPGGQQPLQPVATQGSIPAPAADSSGTTTAATATAALIADDVDLIEKEWVVKAKAIVSQTKDDPYHQNEAMTRVKADYMKKRYNRDLKVGNEQ